MRGMSNEQDDKSSEDTRQSPVGDTKCCGECTGNNCWKYDNR